LETNAAAGAAEIAQSSNVRPMAGARETGRPESVAVVHDYVNQCGGAERVALELARTWPDARLYTSLYRPGATFPAFAELDIRVSPLNRLPVDAGFRALAPLYPLAFRSLGVLSEDVVISSSSGWAHGVRTALGSLHIVYCHTPARWLYRREAHLGRALGPRLLAPLLGPLRHWDQAAARRADVYVANSQQVRDRIQAVYGRSAAVIYPPVNVDQFTPRSRGERLLVISRLLPYKRVDLVVRAASRAGLGLDVVGVGPQMDELRSLAGPTVSFHGRLEERSMVELMESCRALCLAGTEDFGIAPVEAGAAGKPVVAYAEGGALETVQDGVNGALFGELTVEALLEAIGRADDLTTSPGQIAALAGRFSARSFRRRFRELVSDELARRRGQVPESAPARSRSSVA
jgi:glycosyltransferase involved in cell wall biosynthesis